MKPKELNRVLGPTIFERSPCSAIVVDRQHRIVMANTSFGGLFGDSETKECYLAMKGRAQPCVECTVAQTFDDGLEHEAMEEGVGADGSAISFVAHSVPLRTDTDGRVGLVLLYTLDTTHEKELEHQLKQAERLATVGLTTAGLAHSIKSILSGLEGGVYIVNSGLEHNSHERTRAGWDMVQRYIDQVSSLVQNLLQYSKVQESHREVADPAEMVTEIIDLFGDKAALMNVELESQVEEGLTPISLDREALRGCLANLVSNALDACVWDPDTEKSHRIIVRVAPVDHGGAVFEINDNGTGIAQKNQSRALRSSFTTKGMRGTGLGLLLTKKAVEEHGGQISFTTEVGQGTVFRIELPALTIPEPKHGGIK